MNENRNLKLLKDYYRKNHIPLILNDEIKNNEEYARIFIHPLDAIEEFNNFKKIFLEYLPYYVHQPSTIENFNLDDIVENLIKYSKICKESSYIPRRQAKSSGIYGEVYADLYGRIYRNYYGITSYINRRGYDNFEVKGCDDFLLHIDEGAPEIILSESKFVSDLNSATTDLIGDINGTSKEKAHLDKDYINRFTSFTLAQSDHITTYESDILKDFVNKLNIGLVSGDKKFIEIVNENNVSIKFVYFAIFKSSKLELNSYLENFEKIKNNFENKIKFTSILNYSLDIVFIPVENEPKNIRLGIDDEY